MVFPLTPVCSFEELSPRDVLAAIKTNSKPLPRTVVRVAQIGLGYETFLRWALQDVDAAAASTDSDEQTRFSISALMNARRSLSCVADQYLQRDGFTFCRDVPYDTDAKANLLVSRGVFDALAAGALSRAVDRRNRIEHGYDPISTPDARDTVHLIRATVENCVAKSDPYWAPAFFGSFLGGHSGGPGSEEYFFEGWSGLLFVLARCDSPPWFGVVIPSSKSEATVRKVPLSELSNDQLVQALAALEAQSSAGHFRCGESTFRGQLACLGLSK